MSDDHEEPSVEEVRAPSRADLLPEEEAAGSEDPQAQAEAILAESEERIASRDAAPGTHLEQRTSDEVTPPDPAEG